MVDDNNQEPITVELSPAPIKNNSLTQIPRRHWAEENRASVMNWLTFNGKDLLDIALSAVLYVCAPMFSASILLGAETVLTPILLIVFSVAVAVILSGAIWLIKVVPESTALVLGRLVLIAIGLLLGGLL